MATALSGSIEREAVMADVDTYLTVGFAPSWDLASSFLRQLLQPVDVDGAPAQILEQIIQDRVYDAGYRSVVIPLTSGMDSRSILGACLEFYDASAISCFTVGHPEMPDSAGAAATCRRVGVSHQIISPDGLEWDPDDLVSKLREWKARTDALPPLDGVPMFEAIRARVPMDSIVLSGFLGDATTGQRLPRPVPRSDVGSVRTFLHKNTTLIEGWKVPSLVEWFAEFLEEHKYHQDAFSSLTAYDIFDFAFRGRLRIYGTVTGAFERTVCPFEDPRWVSRFLRFDLTSRIGQSEYRSEMRSSYSRVFGEKVRRVAGVRRFLKSMVSERAVERISRVISAGTIRSYATWATRGDPRSNASMAHTMRELLGSFDRRMIIDQSVLPVFERAMARPTPADVRLCRWIASAEAHLRAGHLQERQVERS